MEPSSKSKYTLQATSLASDPRITQAKQLIIEALKDRQRQFNEVRPAVPALKQSYHEMILQFNQYRGGNLYFPFIGSGFGKGCLVELADGSVKYDMICGIGPHFLGHCHPDVVKTSLNAALSDTIMQGHLQQNIDTMELCELLLKTSKMDHCFLASSGAMANENALKIAFQKKHPANRIIAFDHCFAGRTLALAQVTDKPAYREGLPSNLAVDYIPFFNYQNPEESVYLATKALKHHLARYPKQHAAMIFELVQGEGGIYPGTQDFFQSLMQIAKDHHVAIIVDEIQTFGRTPELFAFQYFGLEKYVDIVTIGKLSQIAATVYKTEFKPRPGLLSQTFTGSTSTIQAGKFIIQSLVDGNYFGPSGKINLIHQTFANHFAKLAKQNPGCISGPYGIGAMIAFTPFNGDAKQTAKCVQDLFEEGVISFTAGDNPSRIRFLPPVGAVTDEDINHVMEIVTRVLIKGPS